MSRTDGVCAYHVSTNGKKWTLVRVFSLDDRVLEYRIGFKAQSPTGDGCTVTFGDIRFGQRRLEDLRDGS